MASEFERELAHRIGEDRATAIARELGSELLSNPLLQRGAADAAEAAATIARFRGPSASPHEIAAEFVDRLSRQLG